MQYLKNFYPKIKESLKNKQWYHQRFDGCPAFLSFIAFAELKHEKRKEKYGNHTLRVCFFENPRADWYILQYDIRKTTNEFLEKSKKEKNISKKLIKLWDTDQKEFYKKCLEIERLDLTKLSNEQLIQRYDGFKEIFTSKVTSSAIIDGFALGSDEIIAKFILDLLKQRKQEHTFTEYFSKLTAPTRLSFINEAEISLYEIALSVSGFLPLKDIFIKNKPTVIKLILENPLLYSNKNNSIKINNNLKNNKKIINYNTNLVIKNENLIKNNRNNLKIINKIKKINNLLLKHQQKYFWSKNNYHHDNILTIEHFINEIKEVLTEKIDFKKQIEKIKNTPKNNKKIKDQLFRELKPDLQLKELLQISDDFTWWQDERKKSTFWATHYFNLFLDEIGRRLHIDNLEMKYLSPEEISAIFSKTIDRNELKKRVVKCAFVYTPEGHECITGDEVETLREIILGKQDFSQIKEIKGLCASVGKAIGTVVKVRSATEIYKVGKGDILVAVMTRPDYVVGMKKAAAIVTNEGGVTSHAAIVSRELGIPCVIGTKIAMNVLKDGMKVEVDADHGVVRIIH